MLPQTRSLMRLPLAAAALFALTGCTLVDPTPPIPGAVLNVTPQSLSLRPGERVRVDIDFHEAPNVGVPQVYDLDISSGWQGVRVSPSFGRLRGSERVSLWIEAERGAPDSLQAIYVRVSDSEGRGLMRVLNLRVRAPRVQPAPVRQVPVSGVPVGLEPIDLAPVPVQPAPVVPVPLP